MIKKNMIKKNMKIIKKNMKIIINNMKIIKMNIFKGITIPKPYPLADKPLQANVLGIVSDFDFTILMVKLKDLYLLHQIIINLITDIVGNLSIQVPNIITNVKTIFDIINIFYLLNIILFLVFCFFIFRYSGFNESEVNLEVKMNNSSDNSVIPYNQQYSGIAPGSNGNDDDDDDDNKRNKTPTDRQARKNKNQRQNKPAIRRKKKELNKSSYLTNKDKNVIDKEKKNLTRYFNNEKRKNPNLSIDKFIRFYLNTFRKDPLGQPNLKKE
jgi:hypothetical protein